VACHLQITPIKKRFWWPHPYAREAGLLWRKLTLAYRYYVDGKEVSLWDYQAERFHVEHRDGRHSLSAITEDTRRYLTSPEGQRNVIFVTPTKSPTQDP